MDNFRIDITAEGRERLRDALALGMSNRESTRVFGWEDHPEKGLILYWTDNSLAIEKFPAPLGVEETTAMVWTWLAFTTYPEQEWGGDVSYGKGWRVYNEDWGHVGERWQAILAIQPVWAMYGK